MGGNHVGNLLDAGENMTDPTPTDPRPLEHDVIKARLKRWTDSHAISHVFMGHNNASKDMGYALAVIEALEAQLAETKAMAAAAHEAAAERCEKHARHEVGREAAMLRSHAAYFRALTPADALNRVREDAQREALTWSDEQCRAFARGYDTEDAAQSGERSPWDVDDDPQAAEWEAQRVSCVQQGLAHLAALTYQKGDSHE